MKAISTFVNPNIENPYGLGSLNKFPDETITRIWSYLTPNINLHDFDTKLFLINKQFKKYTFEALQYKQIREISTFALSLSTEIKQFIENEKPDETQVKNIEYFKHKLICFMDENASMIDNIFKAENLPLLTSSVRAVENLIMYTLIPLPIAFSRKCNLKNQLQQLIDCAKTTPTSPILNLPRALLFYASFYDVLKKNNGLEGLTDEALKSALQEEDQAVKDIILNQLNYQYCKLKKFDKALNVTHQIQDIREKKDALFTLAKEGR